MISKLFRTSSAAPFPIWDAPNLAADIAALYDQYYQPKKRAEYTVKDGKLFDPVSGLYIDLELLAYKREEPTDKNFSISAIEIALIKKDYDAVLSMTDNILKKTPGNVAAMCDKAIALSKSGRVEEALALNTHALTLDPRSPALLHNRAIGYLKIGKPQEAVADVEKSMAIDKEKGKQPFLPSYGVLFSAKWGAGDRAAALDVLEQGLSIKRDGAFVPAQMTCLAKHIGCSTPAEAMARIRELRSELGAHVQPPAASATSKASAPVAVPA